MTPAEHATAIMASVRGLAVPEVERLLADASHSAYDHVDAITDAADSADDTLRAAGLSALFAGLVEPLNDSFTPSGRAVYALLFPHLLWRVASRTPWLRSALAEHGVSDLDQLRARYGRRRAAGQAAHPPSPPTASRIVVLSRVTIGADVLLASVALQRLHDAYPSASLHLLGDRKLAGLFGGLPGVSITEVSYPRRGPLSARLAGWLQVRQAVRDLQADLVVAPDSRLDQLGILPLIDESRYLLWENLLPGPARSLADVLDGWLAARLALNALPARLPRLGFDTATQALQVRLGLALGSGSHDCAPLAAVKFDHGGNPAKALPREAEVAILAALRARGWRILLDRGFGEAELANSDALVEQLAMPVLDIDDSGTGRGAAVQEAGPGVWSGTPLLRFHGSIAGWAAALSHCRLAISYDSVGHHLAAAAEVPVVVAFTGYQDERFPVAWQPRGAAPVTVVAIADLDKRQPAQWQRVIDALPQAATAPSRRSRSPEGW
jgi:ADP-heptose:LPS heptosyltransferase